MEKVLMAVSIPTVLLWGARQALKLKDEVRERYDIWRVDNADEAAGEGEAVVLQLARKAQ